MTRNLGVPVGRMKWLALTTAAFLAPSAAQAQQPNPAFNWSGFYIGLNAGGARGAVLCPARNIAAGIVDSRISPLFPAPARG